jgi:two-component system, OmpR family, sensor histidine kinase BaeS
VRRPVLGLRARLVAAFVGIAALTTLVAAVLTSLGVHHQVDAYLAQRTQDAAESSAALAETAYSRSGGWTDRSVDLLAHELSLTGYDFRLVADGRALLDTTKLERDGADFRMVASRPLRSSDGDRVGDLQLFALGPRGNMPADEALRSQLDRSHLIAAAIAALVAMIAGLVMAGRLARPLQRLSATARNLGAGRNIPIPATTGSREVRELGDALSGLAEDLERQQRARHQLAQDLSHELRTPLTLVQSRIEAMQDGILPYGDDGLATLHTETLRLGRLIGQIERLAEAEAQPSTMDSGPIGLDEIAREAHATLAAAFDIRQMTLRLDAPLTPAIGDRDAVAQITGNLLSNALKYAPEGSAVHLSTRREGGRATLCVRDEGTAIAPGESERLFQRFYRGPGAAETSSGAGLGLTIARGLAIAQGGTLDLEVSEAGTRFVLRLPASPSASAGRRGPQERAAVGARSAQPAEPAPASRSGDQP